MYVETTINKPHVREQLASFVCFKLDVHWLTGQDLFGHVDTQTLILVLRVS